MRLYWFCHQDNRFAVTEEWNLNVWWPEKNVGHCLIRLSQIATGKIFDVVILLFMLYWLFSYRMLDVLYLLKFIIA